jgi:hypothetical protein
VRKASKKPLGGGLGLQLREIILPFFIEDGRIAALETAMKLLETETEMLRATFDTRTSLGLWDATKAYRQ